MKIIVISRCQRNIPIVKNRADVPPPGSTFQSLVIYNSQYLSIFCPMTARLPPESPFTACLINK